MKIYFSQKGLALFAEQVRAQEEKVRAVGVEVGAEAGPSCDWHDNFGYEDARRRMDQEAKRLSEMTQILRSAEIVEPQEQSTIVSIGTTVKLLVAGNPKEFTIGAFGETRPEVRLVSYESPLLKPILGKRVGDVVEVKFGETKLRLKCFKSVHHRKGIFRC